jgi:spermidine synthase
MIPWDQLDTATVPGGGEVLRLMRRGTEYSIMAGANELMNSRLSGSEEALATLTCDRIGQRARAHMLIGGLGMGFTLRAALARLQADAVVSVAELVPAVVDWARGPLASIHGASLEDGRVRLYVDDVGGLIRQGAGLYDAILLDVDNGPRGLSQPANNRLYNATGLAEAKTALRSGGVLAIWSAQADDDFTQRLLRAGFATEEVKVRASRAGRGARHHIWLASRV